MLYRFIYRNLASLVILAGTAPLYVDTLSAANSFNNVNAHEMRCDSLLVLSYVSLDDRTAFVIFTNRSRDTLSFVPASRTLHSPYDDQEIFVGRRRDTGCVVWKVRFRTIDSPRPDRGNYIFNGETLYYAAQQTLPGESDTVLTINYADSPPEILLLKLEVLMTPEVYIRTERNSTKYLCATPADYILHSPTGELDDLYYRRFGDD